MSATALHVGDALTVLCTLPDASAQCCVTSPPYWGLRDYGVDGQIGQETTPAEYVERLVAVFAEVRRVLRDDGTLWLNLGDSYAASAGGGQGKNSAFLDRAAGRIGVREQKMSKLCDGLKPKDLVGIPWMVAFALRADGWYLRSDVIWHKPNPMPESVQDRPTKAHEHVFLLSKSERYHYDAKAIAEPATNAGQVTVPEIRNARDVWTIATQPYPESHFAVMPLELARRCVLAGCPAGGTVLDPFMGAGTVALAAQELGRKWIGIEINPDYATLVARRTAQAVLSLGAA